MMLQLSMLPTASLASKDRIIGLRMVKSVSMPTAESARAAVALAAISKNPVAGIRTLPCTLHCRTHFKGIMLSFNQALRT